MVSLLRGGNKKRKTMVKHKVMVRPQLMSHQGICPWSLQISNKKYEQYFNPERNADEESIRWGGAQR